MKRSTSNFVIILLTLPLLVFVGMFLIGSYGIYRASISKSWPTVQGIVISSKVDTTVIHSTRDRTRKEVRTHVSTKFNRKETVISSIYSAVITYKYQVNGVEYQSSNYTTTGAQEGTLTLVQDLVSQLPVNTQLVVHYNPNNPSDALIVLQQVDLFITIFSFIFMVLLIFLILKLFKKRNKINENSSELNN